MDHTFKSTASHPPLSKSYVAEEYIAQVCKRYTRAMHATRAVLAAHGTPLVHVARVAHAAHCARIEHAEHLPLILPTA